MTDSANALDAWRFRSQLSRMDYPALLFHRIDPARNMARFYALAIEPTLFGDLALVRHWGRIGTRGRQMVDLHADYAGALGALERHAARRRKRGYDQRAE